MLGAACAPPAELDDQRAAVTIVLQPDAAAGKDTRAYSLAPNSPAPAVPLLYAMAWTFSGVPGTVRGFLDFELPAAPPGTTLRKAMLVLSAETTVSPYGHSTLSGTNELLVRQITSPWEEDALTWNQQPSTDEASQLVLPESTSPSQTYEIDVTSFVRRELAAPAQYHGFALQLQTEQYYRAVLFGSSDNANAAIRPKLVLEYDQGATGIITGSVCRYSQGGSCGPRVAGATVEVDGGYSTTTDASGEFVLANLPLGRYTVRPRLDGWSFGSAALQDQAYTVTLQNPGDRKRVNVLAYDRDPLVFVHGWTDSPEEFSVAASVLERSGTRVIAHDLETSLAWTPPMFVNARRVRDWIDEAKHLTGRAKAVLYGHSMGGIVARTYLEGPSYRDDVSQLFTAGTPHLGIPTISSLACLPNQPAVCEMTASGMFLFNLVHWKRRGVDYHEIGGDAPMWRTHQWCFRIFRRRFCISIPVPSFEYRNGLFWALGLVIPGKDDGFIRTFSTVGQLSTNIDRYITDEVHDGAHRDYHFWDNAPSACAGRSNASCQAFAQCVYRVLVDRSTTTCGTRNGIGPPLGSFFAPAAVEPGPSPDAQSPQLSHLSKVHEGALLAGQTVERELVLEGGPATFAASWSEGAAEFSLIDPSGLIIDRAYAEGILDPDAAGPVSDELPPEAAWFSRDEHSAFFTVPNARPGAWRMRLRGAADLPSAGARYTMSAAFDGHLAAELRTSHLHREVGAPLELAIELSEPITSGVALVSVSREGVAVDTISLTPQTSTRFAAQWPVPGPAGHLELRWHLIGTRSDGVAFERYGTGALMARSSDLTLTSGHTDRGVPRPDLPGLFEALAIDLHFDSKYADSMMGAAAELYTSDGILIARANAEATTRLGEQSIEVRFAAEDLYRSGRSGPYQVRNVRLLDLRGALLLAGEEELAHVTAAYDYRAFAPSAHAPSVFLEGPFRVAAGATLELQAQGVDPDGDPLRYQWDLDGDGVFEREGRTQVYVAPLLGPARVWSISVRASDAAGLSATASAQLEVFVPVIENLAPAARASAKSSHAGHPVSRINDGSRGTSAGSSEAWVNGLAPRCNGPIPPSDCRNGPQPRDLPTWVQLELRGLRAVRSATLYFTPSQPVSDYQLQLDDGSGWRVVAEVRGNQQAQRVHELPDLPALRVRVWMTRGSEAGPDFVRLNELEVQGY